MLLIHRVKDEEIECIESIEKRKSIQHKTSLASDFNGNENDQGRPYVVQVVSASRVGGWLILSSPIFILIFD